MVQSLESYVAEATQAYQPSTTAIQNQIDALNGQLDATNERINKNYAQQQAGLNRQRNMAAENASLQAAGSGGSFGGAANIANRKYYDQSFVPAQTQLQTNQANELLQARQDSEAQRTNLNSQLANLQAQANQQALAQYYADLEAERAREAQLKAARISAASSNPLAFFPDGYDKSNIGFTDWIQRYSGYDDNTKNKIVNGYNSAYGRNDMLSRLTMKTLQNSDVYKNYLNWRNS